MIIRNHEFSPSDEPYLDKFDQEQNLDQQELEQKIEILRQADWYQEALRGIEFQIKDILHPNTEILDLLTSYGQHLYKTDTPDRDRCILRLELRLEIIEQNKRFAHKLNQYFPGLYDHKLPRLYNHNRKLNPLIYEAEKMTYIVNSVGMNALFNERHDQLMRQIIINNIHKEPTEKEMNNFRFHDYLPGQFLIGRIWCAKNLCIFMEHLKSSEPYERRLKVIYDFEYLNKKVARTLSLSSKYLYSDVCYSITEKNTRFIGEEVDELLTHELHCEGNQQNPKKEWPSYWDSLRANNFK